MKLKSIITGIICLTMIFTYSCKKDKDSIPKVTVTPTPLYISGNVGDLVVFNIVIDSDVALSKFYISQQPENQLPSTVLDSTITSKGTAFNYYYRLPASMAGKSVVFEFKAVDDNGNEGKAVRRVYIAAPTAVTLTETAGHRMYSNLSTNPDAYNLESNVSEFSVTADTSARDMQDASGTDTTLSKTWTSPAGGQFVRNNGFDYANATDVSATNAYNAGLKFSIMSGIAVGDVIIAKLGSITTDKYVVVRVTNIIDNPGKNNDYYEFSVKK
jgi:hypothetical protein